MTSVTELATLHVRRRWIPGPVSDGAWGSSEGPSRDVTGRGLGVGVADWWRGGGRAGAGGACFGRFTLPGTWRRASRGTTDPSGPLARTLPASSRFPGLKSRQSSPRQFRKSVSRHHQVHPREDYPTVSGFSARPSRNLLPLTFRPRAFSTLSSYALLDTSSETSRERTPPGNGNLSGYIKVWPKIECRTKKKTNSVCGH